ncbi:MAG: DUF503 domain-containing protein [Phycisphaeraceae bacterium]|nr:DUF503 domain-containing protein [Phycisphaeraceae bacterium]MCW5753251.1 DUF503 domain-containing protein [Phycisphaeraceae bacterium]
MGKAAMIVGLLQFELLLHDAESLKDKRRVVRSLKDRLHREHMVSVAEVGSADAIGSAVLAVALVGNDGRHIGSVLDAISAKVRGQLDAEVGAMRRQLIHGSQIADLDPADEPDRASIDEEMRRHSLHDAAEEGHA